MIDRNRLLQTAARAARMGGEVLMRYFREGVVIRNKSESGGKTYDLVSDADLESEQTIAQFLRSRFPGHELLGEESLAGGATDAEHLWIIDPLDGTNNFAHRLPHFAVSIAYYHHGQPIVGVVYNPVREEMYTATQGGGAFLNGESVSVCDSQTLSQTLVGCGFYYDRGDMMRSTLAAIEEFFGHDIHGIRRFGTASLDLCQVGCGQFGGFFEYQLSPWDFAAGRLFVTEAGGQVTEGHGQPLPLKTTSLVASNSRLHDAMIEITKRHHP
ncbi:Inositol-1-monophosphatase [Novipirellula galeiformis]|uniref:Inositol-1-monophosphatase n=1 Tax=Novipirellula galeiformis TaxID=2528004 RepID=A0A5C6C860_9BACT|nr:inositol monophosphatase family protein [Novipirellula galeiformis]TWU20285.1 Inositol-1-monophosphatase [Novipirellula galeiformis]